LDEEKMEEVAWLIAGYQEWAEAETRVILEDSDRRKTEQIEEFRAGRVELDRHTESWGIRTWLAMCTAAAAVAVLITAGLWFGNGGNSPRLIAHVQDSHGLVTLKEGGVLSGMERFPDDWKDSVKDLLQKQRVFRNERNRVVVTTLMSDSNVPEKSPYAVLISPVNTAIRGVRPTFKWRPRSRAIGYAVHLSPENLVPGSDVVTDVVV
jgi:hypothetical protein